MVDGSAIVDAPSSGAYDNAELSSGSVADAISDRRMRIRSGNDWCNGTTLRKMICMKPYTMEVWGEGDAALQTSLLCSNAVMA